MREKTTDSQTRDYNEKVTLSELADTFGFHKGLEKLETFELLEDGLEGKTTQEIIEFRFNQPDYSRLAEYITGLRPEDPEMLDKLTYDQDRIRCKYGLPPINWVYENPTEFERFLRYITKKNKSHIRNTSDFRDYFEDSDAGGVYNNETKDVGVDIDKTDENTYLMSLFILEHEVIHSLQQIKFPSMPIEIVEYEAYVANFDLEYLEQERDEIGWGFFGNYIGDSVNSSYARVGEEDAIEPEWKDPEFFLRNIDRVSNKEIEKYKR